MGSSDRDYLHAGEFGKESTSLYEALDVGPDAEYSEIRRRYRAAILALHPDKAQSGEVVQCEGFLRIQRAWEVLSDKESRAAYDQFLVAQRAAKDRELSSKVIFDEILLEDMDEVKDWGYAYLCRCGDFFSISTDELEQACKTGIAGPETSPVDLESLLLPCSSCSLHLRLQL